MTQQTVTWMENFKQEAQALFESMPSSKWKYGIQIGTNAIELPTSLQGGSVEIHCSNNNVTAIDFQTAIQQKPEFLQSYFMKTVVPLTKELAYHAANVSTGSVILVPSNEEATIYLKYRNSNITHTLIIAEQGSKVTVIEHSDDNIPFRSHVIEAVAKDNANITIADVQNHGTTKRIVTKKADVYRDANIQWLDCCLGSVVTKAEIETRLLEPGATTQTWSVFQANKEQHFDIHVASVHKAPHTKSSIITKGVADDNARVIYRGLVNIERQAIHSEGYQKEEVLLLSSDAEADVVPDLQIDNNEVKCSHAASVGQLDKEVLFYLMSRGISESEAKQQVIDGFFQSMFDQLEDKHIQTYLKNLIEPFNAEIVKEDFPILGRTINTKPLVYLDNSATTQKPQVVIDAITHFYQTTNANVHRGIHTLSEEATVQYEAARKTVADFVGAKENEIIFTKNATEALNLAAQITKNLLPGDEIILTVMDHHSNIVPWQEAAKERKLIIKFVTLTPEYTLNLAQFQTLLNERTKIVSLPHISNVLGTINPVKLITTLAHQAGAVVVIDGAQAVPHIEVDVKNLDADMYAFSGHKMCGPTGVGVLYVKENIMKTLPNFMTGGGTIKETTLQGTTFKEGPERFEAGTPNIAQVVGLAAACKYLQNIGMSRIHHHTKELTDYALAELKTIPGLKLYGPTRKDIDRIGVLSFELENIHPHDVAQILDSHGIAVRAGHHCAKPLMQWMNTTGTSRASFYFYNTKDDINALREAIKKVQETFKC